MKRLLCLIIAAALCMSFPSAAAAAAEGLTLPSGITYKDIEGRIDSYVNEHQATTAALSVAVLNRNEIIMEKAYGYIDMENKIENDKNTVLEWGSCTKLLIWVSVMQLAEQGKIDLNEDICTYLPNHFFKKLKYKTPVTMLNLMNHNAGWQETVTDLFIADTSDLNELGDTLQLIEPEQVNKPGEFTAYSNWGAALAGYIVERVSGLPFYEYVHKNIFEPLGMDRTALNPTLSDNEWVAEKRKTEKCYTAAGEPLGTCQYSIALYPSGMATGTLGDFIRFAQALLPAQGENTPLFKQRETLDEMLSPSLFFADNQTARNCHGFWTDEFSVPVLWHNGGTVGSSSWFAFDPLSGAAIIILTNQSSESIYNCGLLPFVFGKISIESSTAAVADISGLYVSSRSCFAGFAKPYSLFNTVQFTSDGQGGFLVSGTKETLKPFRDKSYLMDMGGLKQFLVFPSADDGGNKVLQLQAFDYIEVNGYGIIMEYALILVFLLGALYTFCALMLSLIRILRKKMKFGLVQIYREAANFFVLTVFLLFIYATLKLFSATARINDIRWSIILIAVLTLLSIGYIIYLILRWRKLDCPRKEKIRFIMTSIAVIIMSVNVFFWEAYRI